MVDMVNQPPHYTRGDIECIDALASACHDLQGLEAICTANAIKYLWRWKAKGGVEDLRKARWYIDRLIASTPQLELPLHAAPNPVRTWPTWGVSGDTPVVDFGTAR